MDRFLLYYSSLLPGDWGLWPRRKPQDKRNDASVAGGLKVEFSLKLLPCALHPCLPSKPAPSALLKCTQ